MKITALTPQKRNPGHFNLFLNGKFVCGLDADLIVTHQLVVGQELADSEVKSLLASADFSSFYNKVLNLLSYRPHSIYEVQAYLKKLKASEDVSRQVIAKCQQRKLLDDQAFCKWFVGQRQTYRPRSKRMLMSELKQKGINEEIIATVLSSSDFSEAASAYTLAQKKWRSLSRYDSVKRAEKLKSYLARQGFSWDVIQSVLIQLTAEND
ncbi:TPA: hypothetical protein DIV55_00780 [Patescibacteria group bacterium]|uniref:Regulatory protein RecX n=1 Tax=Candidatus Gottesmanbacteria bacterium GW2011_GWA1_43_11 TaxID=1618436 RepID=A0A0G1CCT3_9BACT|nr:MAG: Regulatory protein RecX [Candidatus Gottesmanbacteria bacterium GW2011_GWA1_43_11]HCS78259.1 hypothetical protein [Patescibacteria group bacterium]